MAGFHAREEFSPGQQLTIGQHSGRLVRIGATKALIDTADGQVSVPNIVLLNEVVRLHPAAEAPLSNAVESAGHVDREDGE
jgi:hypothetical protein